MDFSDLWLMINSLAIMCGIVWVTIEYFQQIMTATLFIIGGFILIVGISWVSEKVIKGSGSAVFILLFFIVAIYLMVTAGPLEPEDTWRGLPGKIR